jgi:glycosyltransferase involved in cell wall biosynthesis
MRRPRLSVILASYNVETELRLCLDSLCASSERDFEVCLCDDGSSDRTRDVARSYQDRLTLKLVTNETNRGVAFARNRALSLATGDFLLFLDADVRFGPDLIERLFESMERTGADALQGIYSSSALDEGLASAYYATFAHHSFLVADRPVDDNVFNAWCALCRRKVMDALGVHPSIPKGVEIENETLGRRIVSRGFRIVLDPSIAVDHHWGGWSKVLFIFTRRIYWWVKIFVATGWRFERCLTNASYGFSTLALPASVAAFAASFVWPGLQYASLALLAAFLIGYASFYRFAFRQKGAAFAAACVALSAGFAFVITASAAASFLEEAFVMLKKGRPTLDAGLFQA